MAQTLATFQWFIRIPLFFFLEEKCDLRVSDRFDTLHANCEQAALESTFLLADEQKSDILAVYPHL